MSICNYSFNFTPVNASIPILPVPNHAIDEQALANGLGGGIYDYQLQAVIPNNPSILNKVFSCARKYFNEKIGSLYDPGNGLRLNTATNHKALMKDAKAAAPQFMKSLREISGASGGDVSFGPEDMFVIKSEGSLKRKIIGDSRAEKISIEQATQKISDALRGIIIIDSEEQVQSITKKVNEWIEQEGGDVSWKNLFQEERDNGYIGIHGKLVLPFTNPKGEKKRIRCELQIHFRSVADGSLDSPKERTHALYKDTETALTKNRSIMSKAITKLSFLSGMASIGNVCRTAEYLISLCPKNPFSPKNLCEDPEFSTICAGNLGIPRNEMPQLSEPVRTAFLKSKEAQGFTITRTSIPAEKLIPVQNELSRRRVEKIAGLFGPGSTSPCEREILVASEGEKHYVIDGHHRYAACRQVGGDQSVLNVHDNVTNVLSELKTFPGVRRSEF